MEDFSRSILIIDDDVTIRKLLSFHLKNNKYKTFEATGPAQGFNFLNSENVDLVLCDVTMDDMDGFTFCRKVRENPKHRFIPFIFVTAKSSMEDKSKALEAGGDDIVTKPFDADELLLKIRALLRRSDIYKTYGVKKDIEESQTNSASKILVVDDDLSLARLFQFNLDKAGFICEISPDAEDGLKKAKSFKPDIIVSDIMMPIVNGYEFRKKILEDNELKSIPFVFLTARNSEDDILEGYNLGITDYVVKTQGPKVVVAKVSAILKSLQKERQKVVTELNKAADSLRAKVVPDDYPNFKNFEIRHWHQPYQGIPGGDFLDYFKIDEENIVIILGDVMGKKWGAWYFAFAYAGYIRSALRIVLQNALEISPSSILRQVNKTVYNDSKISEVFATISIVVINNTTGEVKYTGAGDLPIILRENNGNLKKIRASGLLLGFSENGYYDDVIFKMGKGDMLVMLSDGVSECKNQKNEQFGTVKLDDVIKYAKEFPNTIELIKNELINFSGDKYDDDISLITIKYL